MAPYALLLLPSVSGTAVAELKRSYGPGLTAVLSQLSQSVTATADKAVLDIALTTPRLLSSQCQPRAKAFASVQKLIASFYTLLGALSATESIELDGPGGVDARVFFVDSDPDQDAISRAPPLQGPVIDLQTLAICVRPWNSIFSCQSSEGEALLKSFLGLRKSLLGVEQHPIIHRVPGVAAVAFTQWCEDIPDAHFSANYSVIVGGTFDHLHAGHKLLLTATALALDPSGVEGESNGTSEKLLTVGITGDELLVNKKYADYLESWEERWQGISNFILSILSFEPVDKFVPKVERVSNPGANGKYVLVHASRGIILKLVQISDPFGPTITDRDITALVVSKETRSGGQAVNDEREKKGWPRLEVFEVDILDSGESTTLTNASTESFESKISSTAIRRRRMDLAKGNL